MASMEKRTRNGRTRWYVRYRDPEGKQKSRTFDRKVEAEDFLIGTEHSKRSGAYIDPARGKITVGEWSQEWLAGKLDVTPKTRERYEGIITKHVVPTWGRRQLGAVRHAQVPAWVAGLDLAPASVAKTAGLLSQIFAAAVKDERLVKNPAAGVTLPKVVEAERRYLTHQQVDELAERVGEHFKPFVLTLAYTGLRWGELAALRAGRVDLERRRIRVAESVTPVRGVPTFGQPKWYQKRSVPIPWFLVPILRAQIAGKQPDDLIFLGVRGAVARAQKFQVGALNDAAIAMGLCDWETVVKDGEEVRVATNVFHPHELRHTAASLAIAAGADVKVVQQMLGHKSATLTLDLYGHLFPDRLDQVADAMDAARASMINSGTRRVHMSPVNDPVAPTLANVSA